MLIVNFHVLCGFTELFLVSYPSTAFVTYFLIRGGTKHAAAIIAKRI